MNGSHIQQKTSIATRMQLGLFSGLGILLALAAVMYMQNETSLPGKISPERSAQVRFIASPAMWESSGADQAFREKRMQWEQRLLELRRIKLDTSHPDAETARKLIPLCQKAEDMSRRLEYLGENQPALRQQIKNELSRIRHQVSALGIPME